MECPRCTRKAPEDARFCPACGTPLVAGADPHRFASPGVYTPTHLAERILTSRTSLEGERKQVTVLFADLAGSMELLAGLDPEEAERLLDQVLELMMEAVHRYEGTVNQVMGDGLMALFGAPLAHEDHAVRACYAALRMQERVTSLGDALQRAGGVPLLIRVGLNSGEVVVRSIESDLRMTYTAVGQTVHLAARMEQMAKPGSILAAAGTIAMAGERVRSRPLGAVAVKGLAAPVDVHEVLGAAELSSRVEAGRAAARLVGRAGELDRLGALLQAAIDGAGQAVAISGEAGVGKSRLVHEFVRRCRAEGCLVVETVAVSYGRAMAYRPGLAMIRRYFGLAAGDDAAAVRRRVTEAMTALDPALEDAVAPMLWLLGGLVPGSPFLALDPAARRRRAMDAVVRLVAAQARRQPFVMVIEDLQWADSETRASLEALVSRLPPRALVLATCRAGWADGWGDGPHVTRLRLDPLPPSAALDLLDALLGPGADVRALRPVLIERTRGNPLFLEECVRSLAETGVLQGERGAYRLTGAMAPLAVPATVRAVLEARIDRLPAEHKRLLQCAAVIGEEFPVSLLEAVADLPADAVREGLEALREAALVAETALFPDLQYAFAHALAHDVAYDGLLHERRRALHARVVDALERLDPARRQEQVERLAHHALQGELWETAVTSLREAGLRAQARLAGREAVRFFDQALAALAHLPDTPANRALGIDLRCDLRNTLVPLGDHPRLFAVLRDAEALARSLGDERRLGRVLSYLSNYYWNVGEADASVEAGQQTREIAERLQDLDLTVVSQLSLGAAYRALGDYRRAVDYLRRNVELLGGDAERERFGLAGLASVLSRGHLVWSLAELGEFDEAVRLAEEAIGLARIADDAYSLAHAHLGLGGVLVRQGRFGEAMVVLERGLKHAEEVPVLRPPLAADLALTYAISGRAGHAQELAEEAVAGAQGMGRVGRLSLLTTHLGEVHLLAGRVDDAHREGLRALELARALKERGNEVYALRLLGLAAAEREPADLGAAAAHYAAALAIAEELGMRPLAARCHLGLGRLARRGGDAEAAQRHLVRAAALLEELKMRFWLDRLALDRVGPGDERPA